jgi:hypothetical protein
MALRVDKPPVETRNKANSARETTVRPVINAFKVAFDQFVGGNGILLASLLPIAL